jgi:hypothetical protein
MVNGNLGKLRTVGRTPCTLGDLIGGKLFDCFRAIYKAIVVPYSRAIWAKAPGARLGGSSVVCPRTNAAANPTRNR